MEVRLSAVNDVTDESDVLALVNEQLVEDIWDDLEGRVTRENILQVAIEVATKFQDAAVTSFVPIFIRRQTSERLKARLSE
ncbi:MAG TPA: hypothetical protein VF177_07315 [Anaerolineae bacterium]